MQTAIKAKAPFEPSQLIDHGAAEAVTEGGGGPAAQPDGNVYNS